MHGDKEGELRHKQAIPVRFVCWNLACSSFVSHLPPLFLCLCFLSLESIFLILDLLRILKSVLVQVASILTRLSQICHQSTEVPRGAGAASGNTNLLIEA
jgi:hypothetical protein